MFDQDIGEKEIEACIEDAILAPSGENEQTWKYSVEKNRLDVYLDLIDQSFFNYKQIPSIIACGAFIENLMISASNRGFEVLKEASLEAHKPENGLCLLASFEFSRTGHKKTPLFQSIAKRTTNRKMYASRKIPKGKMDEIQKRLKERYPVDLSCFSNQKDMDLISELIYLSNRLMMERQDTHEHFHKHVHLNKEDFLRHRTGFPIKNLQAGFAGDMFLKFTRPWPVMKKMVALGLGKKVAQVSQKSALRSSHLCFLSLSNSDNYLEGGCALQNFWLQLTKEGFAAQPMVAPIFLYLRAKKEGNASFPAHHQVQLAEFMEKYESFMKAQFMDPEKVFFLIRTGYATEIKVKTIRKKLDMLRV